MPLELTLITAADSPDIVANLGHPDQPLAPPTPLAGMPRIEDESNPFVINPLDPGQALFRAMGGETLLAHLEQTADRLLLLITDTQTAALPWEYAVLPNGDMLGRRFGLLRLLPEAPPARPTPTGPLNLAVLAADPLVDPQGQPIPAYRRFGPPPATAETTPRLNLEDELQALRQTLSQSDQALTAHRLPPTETHLGQALRRGPAILHLSCHGNVIEQSSGGRVTFQPVLALEDDHGQLKPLRGDRLTHLPPPGVLRLVVLSACRTALAGDAGLARALVLAGSAPAAIGMQGDFPDPASAAFAANLYDSLLLGLDLAESLRQARHSLPDGYAGLPVAYVTRRG